MSRRRVTIVDIARELGISKSLVSNALHDRGRVSTATRAQVQETAERMGYVSNRAAQQLRSSRFGTVGLAIPARLRALSFYMQVALGVSEACAEIGSDLMLYTHFDESSRVSLNVPLDGVIVCDPSPADPLVEQFAHARIPVVTIGHVAEAQLSRVSGTVSIDFTEMVAEVLHRLREHGEAAAPALFLADLPILPVWLEETCTAFAQQCRRIGTPVQQVTLPFRPGDASAPGHPRSQQPDGEAALRSFVADQLAHSHSAWIVAYQGLASTLRRLAVEMSPGVRLPRIVALPGDPVSDAFDPDILSVDFRAHEYGYTAARMLGDVIEHAEDKDEHLLLQASHLTSLAAD